jgi:hypothetical protein
VPPSPRRVGVEKIRGALNHCVPSTLLGTIDEPRTVPYYALHTRRGQTKTKIKADALEDPWFYGLIQSYPFF